MTEIRQIPFGRPWITDQDRQAVLQVLDGPILTHGPQGKAFEQEFAAFAGEGGGCLSVSSCMAALHLASLHFGLGPGDDVIVPAQTHVATAHAIESVGARPVFVDCEASTGNLTAEGIAAALTSRTRAISVVHFNGIPCDMPAIAALAERHRLVLIEDCALAVGTRWGGRHVGLFGDVGCFSFYPVKHIATGDGGMVISRHPEVLEGIARLRAFGVDRTHGERVLPGMYDVPGLGLNYRMGEMPAALGRSQLRRIDENLKVRQSNFETLRAGLTGLADVRVIDAQSPAATSSHYCLSVVLEGARGARRNEVVSRLNALGVGTSVYYPQPVPRMTYYRNRYGYDAAAFPHATAISDRSIALPVAPHVTGADIDHIVTSVRRTLEEIR